MASVVEFVQSGSNNGAANITAANGLVLNSTPQPGDILIVAVRSTRTTGARTVTGITGCGGTWTQAYAGTRISYWISTDATANASLGSATALTVALSGVGSATASIYLLRGLTSSTVVGATTNGTGTSRAGTAQTATSGQIAIAAATALAGTMTYPSATTPSSGWVTAPVVTESGGVSSGDAHRIPTASASHSTSVASTSSTNLEVTSIVLGSPVAAGSETGTVTATSPAHTAALAGDVIVPITGTVTATSPAHTAAATGTVVGDATTGTATAIGPAHTATIRGNATTPSAGSTAEVGFTLGLTATSSTHQVAHATAALGFTLGLTATATTAAAVEPPVTLGFTLGLRVTQARDWGKDPRTGRPGYRVKIVTRTNVGVVELDKAIVAPVTDGVNLVDAWSFRIPRANRKGKKIKPAEHLAQLWRGNIMLTKGPIGPARPDGTWLTYDVRRIDWDLREHRVIGRIPKRQLLRNPGFTQGPDGLAHWNGGWDSESALKAAPTARVVDDPYAIPGTRALEMGAVDKVVTRKVDVESPAVFVPNSATYLSGGEAKIKAAGDDIPEGSVVRITGFTANDGTGDGLALSLKRAQAAKNTLEAMDKKFVFKLPENLKTPNRNDGTVAGRGYYEPVATNKTEPGRRKNRRVSIAYEGTQKAEGHQQYYYQRLTITQAAALKVPLVVTLAGDMQILRWDGAPKDGWAMRLMVLDIVATKETVETGAVFAPNSAAYLSGGEDKIKEIGKKIPEGATINLVGHTADNRRNGDTGTGLDLSVARAQAAKATLAGLDRKFKFALPKTWTEIPANQRRDDGTVGGRGYFDPVASNATDAGQAKNRRVELFYTAQTVVKEGSESSATMDEFTPRVRWADYQTSVEIPADGKPRTVEARLYPPAGASRWVNVGLWPEEQIGLFNVDQALHVKTWVEHAQDEAMGHADLGIKTRTRLTGVPRTVERRFSERMPVGTQLDWYTAIHNGLDIDCEVTPTTATIVTHYPRQGGTADLMLTHGKPGSNIKDYRPLTTSMRDLASSVIMQADGSGAARPEAYASNRKALAGTLLEAVIAAEQETPPAELAQGARVALDQSLHPRPGWEVTIDPAKTTEVLDKIGKGDLVRIQLPDEDLDGLLRVMQRRLDPTTDTLTLTLVEEP